MGQYALLIVGMVIGGIVTAGIWGITGYVKSRALRQKNERCEELISSVEEKWVDVENLVRLYRSGRLNMNVFRNSLDEKVESINRLYKPSMHQLDIFFVKYTEKLIEEYRSMVMSGSAQVQPASQTAGLEAAAETTRTAEIPAAASAPKGVPIDATLPVAETALPAPAEEQIISDMTDAAFRDGNLQLEAFLEMEPASSANETIEPVQEAEEIARAAETKSPAADASLDPEAVTGLEGVPPLPPEDFAKLQLDEPYAGLEESEVKTSFVLPLPADTEARISEIRNAEETIMKPPEGQFSFSGRVSSGQEFGPVSPPPAVEPPQPQPQPQPFTLPSKSRGHRTPSTPPSPAFTKEEVAQPATIFDVEAETIIVDRSTIMGNRPAPAHAPESDKKSIGITGEDVSDAFDAFFGPGKK